MTCVFGPHCFSAEANAASRLVQPSELRFARKSRAAATLPVSVAVDFANAQSQVTSQVARFAVSFGDSDANIEAITAVCAARCDASIEAEVSARISK